MADPAALRYAQLVARGVIRPALEMDEGVRDRTWARFRGLGAGAGTARAILDAERDE